jgi:hypothetical protein
MLRRVALVKTDVSEESGASFIRVTRIGELGTTQAETSNRRTQRTSAVSNIQKILVKNVRYIIRLDIPVVQFKRVWHTIISGGFMR